MTAVIADVPKELQTEQVSNWWQAVMSQLGAKAAIWPPSHPKQASS